MINNFAKTACIVLLALFMAVVFVKWIDQGSTHDDAMAVLPDAAVVWTDGEVDKKVYNSGELVEFKDLEDPPEDCGIEIMTCDMDKDGKEVCGEPTCVSASEVLEIINDPAEQQPGFAIYSDENWRPEKFTLSLHYKVPFEVCFESKDHVDCTLYDSGQIFRAIRALMRGQDLADEFNKKIELKSKENKVND